MRKIKYLADECNVSDRGYRKSRQIYWGLRQRCSNPRMIQYKRYGGRGIRAHIKFDEIISLWKRDNADSLKQPSLDRIDNDGNYTVENCRFIEFRENQLRSVIGKIPHNLGKDTRKIYHCPLCGEEFRDYEARTFCSKRCQYKGLSIRQGKKYGKS
jgi:hypothetical protein